MKIYTYYFVDGTKSEVEVSDELYKILIQMDKDERNNDRANTRRHSSISNVNDKNDYIEDRNADLDTVLERMAQSRKFDAALDTLTESQRKLFEAVYYEKKKVIDIASEQGVVQSAISNRLERLKRKLQNFLDRP